MADNTKQQDNALISTEEVTTLNGGGVTAQQVQRFIPSLRMADGTAIDVTSAAPLPVKDTAAEALLSELSELLTGIGGSTEPLAGLLSSIDADTGVMATALALLDNAIAGSEMQVDVVGALPAGTNAIGKLAANSGVDIGDVDVTSLTGGTVAHDAVDSGNPIKVGARACTELLSPVTQNDRADLMTDKHGRLLTTVIPHNQRVSETLNRTNTEAGQLLVNATNMAYVVTAITVVNAHATVGTKVEILNGASVKWKGYAGALGGGFAIADPNGLFVGTANTKLEGKCVTTGADVDITVSGYKIPA